MSLVCGVCLEGLSIVGLFFSICVLFVYRCVLSIVGFVVFSSACRFL